MRIDFIFQQQFKSSVRRLLFFHCFVESAAAVICFSPCLPLCCVTAGTDRYVDFFVGDVASYTLHNLQPGTTYDVKVIAQYTGGLSAPLAGAGTTRTYRNRATRPTDESFIKMF